jgi:CRISPR-associated Csx11 family protein
MSEFEPAAAEKLRDHRPLLLAMEAVGWLHMAGKAKADFLRGQGGQHNGYKYETWFDHENPPFPWSNLLNWVKIQYPLNNNTWPSTLTDFLTEHTKSNPGLLGLLQAGHGMASGIEKNLPKNTSNYLKQDTTDIWQSSAFGYPVQKLLSDPPYVLTDAGWRELVEQIRWILDELKSLGTNETKDKEIWWQWRENAIGQDRFLRQAFMSTVAETRLPNNDVTLWDQSYVAAALFKSAVAGAILDRGFHWNGIGVKQKTRWRLLTIGIGTDHYESRAVKIGDWKGAQQAIEDFFSEMRKLVEVDLACGSLLYKDTEVAVFSFPGEQEGANTDRSIIESWEGYFRLQADDIAKKLDLETPSYCKISDPSRSLILLTQESQKARKTLEVPIHRYWEIPSKTSLVKQGHVCPVCFVRLNEKYSDKQKPCPVCYDRRHRRLNAWLGGGLENDTIWIGEIVDSNDRAALLTFSLDIEPWLDGTRIDSFRSQSTQEWRRHNSVLNSKDNPIDLLDPYNSLLGYVCGKLNRFDKNDPVLSSLQDGYRHESDWPSFFRKIVEDRTDAQSWDKLDDIERTSWLVHQLFRKLASPGRIFRFWSQAEEFFQDRLQNFREICSRDSNRWRVRRLILTPDPFTSTGWDDHEVYSTRWRNVPMELFYRQGKFFTICNLARLLGAKEAKDLLKGKALSLRDDKGRERLLKVEDVKDDVGSLGIYHPIIPLDHSPLRFRVIVPLAAASECIDRTIKAWDDEFGCVWERLPLRVGIVAFSRMMPFQAVIEATRNIEDELRKGSERSETWRVAESTARGGVAALHLIRKDEEHEIKAVPIHLPDGREDVFYSYMTVEDSSVRFARDFQHPNGQVYRHVEDLRPGDGVKVIPSVVASLFLETTAARFDPLDVRYLADWKAMQDVWGIVQRTAPSQTALRGLWSELEAYRETWRDPDGSWPDGGEEAWLELARATLSNRMAARGASLDALVDSARTGLLRWSLEWHLRVLKESAGGKL